MEMSRLEKFGLAVVSLILSVIVWDGDNNAERNLFGIFTVAGTLVLFLSALFPSEENPVIKFLGSILGVIGAVALVLFVFVAPFVSCLRQL